MFFYASKLFWFFVQPINLAIFLVLIGLVAGMFRWRRAMFAGVALGGAVLFLSAWTSLGALMLHPLEERFTRPADPPASVAGIIVLGGGFEGAINLARGGYELNSAGDRFVETAVLARRYPDATVLVSGGTGALVLEGEADATTAERLLTGLGVAPDRLVLESRSRNTDENARFSYELARPAAGGTWLLVTSAFHMPRAVALFRKAGFDVIAWPTDYRTSGREGFGLFRDNPIDALQNMSLALREWLGLIAYRLSGRIDRLLPEPGQAS